jgi:hypothetical protein
MRRPTVGVPVASGNHRGNDGFLMRRPTVGVPVASGNYWGNDGFGPFFQRQLELPTSEHASARGPILFKKPPWGWLLSTATNSVR